MVWDHDNTWRIGRVAEIDRQLAQHWAQAVIAATRAGDPLAYGLDRLRAARRTTLTHLARLDGAIPPDVIDQHARAKADLAHQRVNRQWAEQQHQHAQHRLDDLQRRPSRRNRDLTQARQAVEQTTIDLEQATQEERGAATKVQGYTEQLHRRQQALTETSHQRHDLADAARQLTAALDYARAERVIAAARGEAGHEHLYQTLGHPPPTRGGLGVWCALANRIEADNDTRAATNRDSHRPDDPAERIAQRLERMTRPMRDDAHLIADATDLIDTAERLDPRPAPDPASLDSAYCARLLERSAAVERTLAPERDLGIELGL
jgi:hypothetical protein